MSDYTKLGAIADRAVRNEAGIPLDFKGRPKRYIGKCHCGAEIRQFGINQLKDYDPPECPECTRSTLIRNEQRDYFREKKKREAYNLIDHKYLGCTFDNWIPETSEQEVNKRKCKDFAMDSHKKWLLIWGEVGTGKTKMLNILAQYFISLDLKIRLVDFKGLYDELLDVQRGRILEKDVPIRTTKYMRDISSYDVLLIDEYMRYSMTDAEKKFSFDLMLHFSGESRRGR